MGKAYKYIYVTRPRDVDGGLRIYFNKKQSDLHYDDFMLRKRRMQVAAMSHNLIYSWDG